MSAGPVCMHSEFNHAKDVTTHLLQIWIQASVTGVTPSYQQKAFADTEKQGRLCLIASPDGASGSVSLHADARLYAGLFDAGQSGHVVTGAGTQRLHLSGAWPIDGQRSSAGTRVTLRCWPMRWRCS
jgi:redox-sensitive bicupin YhaK (pirin superfamily)